MLKNITLSADGSLILRARKRALHDNKSLNEVFRVWLKSYVGKVRTKNEYYALMKQLDHVRAHGHYTRNEMNER